MLFGTNSGVFVLVRWAPVVLLGGSLVLVLLSLRVVILMGFMARWVFSYVPLWGHLILANPDLAAIQGRTERVRALDTRAAARQNYTQYWGFL